MHLFFRPRTKKEHNKGKRLKRKKINKFIIIRVFVYNLTISDLVNNNFEFCAKYNKAMLCTD